MEKAQVMLLALALPFGLRPVDGLFFTFTVVMTALGLFLIYRLTGLGVADLRAVLTTVESVGEHEKRLVALEEAHRETNYKLGTLDVALNSLASRLNMTLYETTKPISQRLDRIEKRLEQVAQNVETLLQANGKRGNP
jgi:hypothetical protein